MEISGKKLFLEASQLPGVTTVLLSMGTLENSREVASLSLQPSSPQQVKLGRQSFPSQEHGLGHRASWTMPVEAQAGLGHSGLSQEWGTGLLAVHPGSPCTFSNKILSGISSAGYLCLQLPSQQRLLYTMESWGWVFMMCKRN